MGKVYVPIIALFILAGCSTEKSSIDDSSPVGPSGGANMVFVYYDYHQNGDYVYYTGEIENTGSGRAKNVKVYIRIKTSASGYSANLTDTFSDSFYPGDSANFTTNTQSVGVGWQWEDAWITWTE